MASSINITFLGTGSATPCSTRNQSALALRLNGDVWIFDCGEATLHQVQKSSVKMGKIQKFFITHTHGDHIFGLVPLLSSRLNGAGGLALGQEDPRTKIDMTQQHIEIYGPLGTRAYVRAGLIYTHTLLDAPYVVHELHTPSDSQDDRPDPPLHPAESSLGRNIPLVDGVWRDIYKDETVSVSAAPILHSVPCIGYVVNEAPVPGKMDSRDYIPHIKRTKTPMSIMGQLQKGESVTLADGTVLRGPERRKGRKIVILGDTYDPSPMLPLAEGADILVHEATNAYLPGIDSLTKDSDTYESVETRAKSRGHSTPQMAGAFARRVNAKRLVLNHFSSRYSGAQTDEAKKIMSSIADLAAREYSGDVICAEDLMSIDINLEPIV
ncbi:Metallo-hydrolase oxidoreductase [Amanita rubescens]|nr:Metallo-hydrolase oxidoreductase [Amanita rubescens]